MGVGPRRTPARIIRTMSPLGRPCKFSPSKTCRRRGTFPRACRWKRCMPRHLTRSTISPWRPPLVGGRLHKRNIASPLRPHHPPRLEARSGNSCRNSRRQKQRLTLPRTGSYSSRARGARGQSSSIYGSSCGGSAAHRIRIKNGRRAAKSNRMPHALCASTSIGNGKRCTSSPHRTKRSTHSPDSSASTSST